MFHLQESELEKLYFFIYFITFYKITHLNRNVSVNNANSSDFHQTINSYIEVYVDYHS